MDNPLRTTERKIIHVDMDAFFAAIEQRDDPTLVGKPVVVGGSPKSRGVVATASYEARKFGIGSAMSCAKAYRLCPEALFVKPRFEIYKRVSAQVMGILREYSPLVEPLSLDEAFIDVTVNSQKKRFARDVAREMRRRIHEHTGLTASAGVAPNKFLAKVASDMRKPDGLMIIPPERVETFLKDLPVRKIPGIGAVTERKMHSHAIFTVGDLAGHSLASLTSLFGKQGAWYHCVAEGRDERPVVPHRERKSVGCEDTFSRDILELDEIWTELEVIAEKLEGRLAKRELEGRTVTLKVTYADFEKITRSRTLGSPVSTKSDLLSCARRLAKETELGKRPIRLLGISVSNLWVEEDGREERAFGQLSLL